MRSRSLLLPLVMGFGTLVVLIAVLGVGAIRRARAIYDEMEATQDLYLQSESSRRDIATDMYLAGMPGMSGSGTTSAVYFVIANDGSEADALIGAATEAARKADIHETRVQNDVAEMVPVPRVVVPARGRVAFKPGGYHVMLVGLTRELKEGETLKLTLQFEKSRAITLDAPIRQER